MNWSEHFNAWKAVFRKPGPEAHLRMMDARKRVKENSPADWDWLSDALADQERKLFVALVFEKQPVPKRLVQQFLLAAVLEKNPSLNRVFVEPCVRSRGADAVREQLLGFLESGSTAERAGASSALYWVRGGTNEEIRTRIREVLLHQFVEIEDIEVRRRTLPQLKLEASLYREELRPLVEKAIAIARDHADEYLRHRVEIQLGAAGPYKAIPT